MKRRLARAAAAAGVLIAVSALSIWWRFEQDIRSASARSAQDGTMIATRCGPIEVQQAGAGVPLLLDAQLATAWHDTVHALRPGLSYLALYLGFEGDIAAAGASAANVWVYESNDIGRVWQAPADADAPGLFVSSPSLKDPAYIGKHTAEVVALCDARAFKPWLHLPAGERPQEYLALKALIEQRMLAQFGRHFPALAPMLRFHELSTPVTQQHFVRSPDGAMYGIDMSAQRLGSDALDVRTPVPGLLLAGQDVSGPGIQAACMSGLLAAAAIEPSLLRRLGG